MIAWERRRFPHTAATIPASLTILPHSAELDLDETGQFLRRRGKSFEADVLEFRLDLGAVDDLRSAVFSWR